MTKNLGLMTYADLTKLVERQERRNARRTHWGRWQVDRERNVLVHERTLYEVDLDLMGTPAAVLDWIFQVTGKTWCSTRDAKNLLEALRFFVDPQSRLCSWAINEARVSSGRPPVITIEKVA